MAADDTTLEKPKADVLPPVEDIGGDVRLKPAPVEPPEKPLSMQAQELYLERLRRQVEREDESDRRRAESEARQDEATRLLIEERRRAAEEQTRDIQESRRYREEHPRPQPPTIPSAPEFHLTPPPGLFGDTGTPEGKSAPGNQWMQAISMFGALGSGSDRRSSMAAIAAMTGMLEGWAKGQKEQYQENYKRWQDESRNIENNYRRQTEYYDAVLNDKKLSLEEKKQELALRAGEFQDTITQELAVQGRLDAVDERMKKRSATLKDIAEAYKKMEDMNTDASIPGGVDAAARTYIETGKLDGRSYKGNLRIKDRANQILETEVGITDPTERAKLLAANEIAFKKRSAIEISGGRAGEVGTIQEEFSEIRRIDNYISAVAPWERFVKGQFADLVTLGERRHNTLGIPIADAYIQGGAAAVSNDPDAVQFMSQLPSVQNDLIGVLTRGASQGALSVRAINEGQKLLPAGYSSENLARLKRLFDRDMERRVFELVKESNEHRQRLRDRGINIDLLKEPTIPELPPPGRPGGRSGFSPKGTEKTFRGQTYIKKTDDTTTDYDENNWELKR